mgnify:CR=1 FL=1
MTYEEIWEAARVAHAEAYHAINPLGDFDDKMERAEQAALAAGAAVLRHHLIPLATVDDGELVERSAEVRSELWAALIGNDQSHKDLIDRIEALTAENERLREALEQLEADCDADYPPSHGAIKYAARAALGDTQ